MQDNLKHFIAALDEKPYDQTTRSIMADFVEEHAESKEDMIFSIGLRWMVEKDRFPVLYTNDWNEYLGDWVSEGWHWIYGIGGSPYIGDVFDWYNTVRKYPNLELSGFSSRHEAEIFLAKLLFLEGITKLS